MLFMITYAMFPRRLTEGLSEVLANSDYVCTILPSTPLTSGLLNGDILKHCSKKVIQNASTLIQYHNY